MMGAKIVAVIAGLMGCDEEDADVSGAYMPAKLRGPPTCVSLPKTRWPKWWHDLPFDDPVCRLDKALYGHKRAGNEWQTHRDDRLCMRIRSP